MTLEVLYDLNSHVVRFGPLTNASTDALISDATVSMTMKDRVDTELSGETWPLAMSADGSNPGYYEAQLSASIVMAQGDVVAIEIDADAGNGLIGHWEERRRVQLRGI